MPDFNVEGWALFLPQEESFLIFDSNVTLFKRQGGLYRLDPRRGKKTLLLPVSTTPLGGVWKVEDMALDPDGRHLYLAERLAARGPGGIAFLVIDLASRQILCRDVLIEDRWVSSPHLALGGHAIGLSYLDEAAQTVVLRYYATPFFQRPDADER